MLALFTNFHSQHTCICVQNQGSKAYSSYQIIVLHFQGKRAFYLLSKKLLRVDIFQKFLTDLWYD
jgi:hypothetical protein